MPIFEQINPTTYRIVSGRDAIEIGNIDDVKCLAHLKHKRWHGNSEFVLSYPGSPTGLARVDITSGTLTIEYGDVDVELTAHDSDNENPDGRSEFNIILKSKPQPDINGDYWQVLDFASTGLNFERVLGLDEEWPQERCHEEWYLDLYDNHEGNKLYGHDNGTGIFVRTPTEIRTPDGAIVLKSKPEHLVHSLLGTAIKNTHKKHNYGKVEIKSSPYYGKEIIKASVSRDHARLPRRELVDNKGNKARIEDVQLIGNQLWFKLPKDFIEKAKYPVQHITGLDPAYTEDMDTFGPGLTEGNWTDYDIFTLKGTPKNSVVEIILSNDDAGKEFWAGIRTDGSGIDRRVQLMEAEGGGASACRILTLVDNGTGLVEYYTEDNSDIIFTIVGYWEHVAFTERFDDETPGVSAVWVETTLTDAGSASKVCDFLLCNNRDANICNMGSRDTSSAVARRISILEAEGGGSSCLNMMTKADANHKADLYTGTHTDSQIFNTGYFGVELDFTELFQGFANDGDGDWDINDLTAFLDEDGRVVDLCLLHNDDGSAPYILGARDGDDVATNRYIGLKEREAASGFIGFAISANTNASGEIKSYSNTTDEFFYLMGYFKPSAAGPQELTAAAVAETSSVVTATISGTGDAPLTGAIVDVASSVQVATIAGSGDAPLTGTIVSVTSSVVNSSIENVSAEQELTAAAVSVTSSVSLATIAGSGDAPLTATVVSVTSSVQIAAIAGSGDAPLTGTIVSVTSSVVNAGVGFVLQAASVAVTSSVSTASIAGSGDAPLMGAVVGVTSSVQVASISGSGNAPLTAAVVSATSSVQVASIAGSGNAPLTAASVQVISSVQNASLAGSGNAPLTGAIIDVASSVVNATLAPSGFAPLTGAVVNVTSSVVASSIAGSGDAPLTGTTASAASSVSPASIVGTGTAPLTGSIVSVLASVVAATLAGSGDAPLTGAIVAVTSSVERAVIAGTGIADLIASPVGVVTSVSSGVAELLALILYASPLAVITSVVETNITLSWILVCEDLRIDPSSLEATRIPISRLEPTRITSSRLPLCRPERRYT